MRNAFVDPLFIYYFRISRQQVDSRQKNRRIHRVIKQVSNLFIVRSFSDASFCQFSVPHLHLLKVFRHWLRITVPNCLRTAM